MALPPAIAVLSDDVLLFIFSLIAPSWWIDADLKTIRHASQVCVHWRKIALGAPSLWRVIAIGQCPRKWYEELLMRASSETSIDVINNHRGESLTSLIPKLKLPLRVYWGWVTVEEMRWILNGMQSPQGRMEYLNVTFRADNRTGEVMPLPSTCQVPSLQELCLNHGMLDLSSPLFPHLKILKLNLCSLPISVLCRYLFNFPSLVELTLNSTIKHLSSVPLPMLDFPNLTHLGLSDDLRPGWQFLSHIHLPAGCHFNLQFKTGGARFEECYSSTVSFVLKRLSEFDIHKLTITQSIKGISISTSDHRSGLPQSSLVIDDDVTAIGVSTNDYPLVRLQIDEALQTLNFKELDIDMDLPGDSYEFSPFLSRAHEQVKLTNCSMNFCEPIFASMILLDISTINPKIEVCKFFDVFKNMPILESLRVENALIESSQIEGFGYLAGKLTRFVYTGSGGAYGQLISRLSLPFCRFQLDLAADTIEPYLGFTLNNFARGIRNAQKDYAINALTIAQVVHEPSLGFRGWLRNREAVITCSDSSGSDADNTIHIRFREFETPLQNLVMKSLLAALHSVYADFTVLHSCHIPEMIPYLDKFFYLRILNIMTIDDLDDTTHMLPLLKRADVHDIPFFPSLTTLILDACHLHMTPEIFSMLCSVLDWRRTRQTPITNLIFSFKYFTATEVRKDHIETLQAMGVCVETSDIERGRSRDLHFNSNGFLVI